MYSSAVVNGYGAPGVEHATSRGPKWAWHVPCENYPLSRGFHNGIWNWHGGEQSLCVGMQRVLVQLVTVGYLGNLTQVHHHYPVTYVTYYGEIVGNEEVGQIELRLKFLQEVYKLGLNGHVQGGYWLVTGYEVGPYRS